MRTHLLRGVVFPFDPPDSKLCVAALDASAYAVGEVVCAFEVRCFEDWLPGG